MRKLHLRDIQVGKLAKCFFVAVVVLIALTLACRVAVVRNWLSVAYAAEAFLNGSPVEGAPLLQIVAIRSEGNTSGSAFVCGAHVVLISPAKVGTVLRSGEGIRTGSCEVDLAICPDTAIGSNIDLLTQNDANANGNAGVDLRIGWENGIEVLGVTDSGPICRAKIALASTDDRQIFVRESKIYVVPFRASFAQRFVPNKTACVH